MKSFKQYVLEMNVAGDGGVFGTASSMGHGGSIGNTDFYGQEDIRIPTILGAKKKGKKAKIVVQRRTLANY